MKAVIQRVTNANVKVDNKIIGEIENGFLILLGVYENDTAEQSKLLAQKVANLRIFSDENDKMNLSLLDISGEALVISNFTLCASTKKGNRPSFTHALEPIAANELYELFCSELKTNGVKNVEKGEFGADMKVSLVNDGPITMILDTDIWSKKNEL